ncbi:hypothetical protein H1C71_033289 [Ictidomys tridecemlineatus]|nr:hypothetical protein H1C71_033289 [Ictidomys tridecemlineatus]
MLSVVTSWEGQLFAWPPSAVNCLTEPSGSSEPEDPFHCSCPEAGEPCQSKPCNANLCLFSEDRGTSCSDSMSISRSLRKSQSGRNQHRRVMPPRLIAQPTIAN